MTLLCVLVGFGKSTRATEPKVWNPTWTAYEAEWGSEFERVLVAVKDKQFDRARAKLTDLNLVLAKLNLLAQGTVKTQERETIAALRRVIVGESRKAAGRCTFYSESDQDILRVLLSELSERATDTRALARVVSPVQWRKWKQQLAYHGGIGGVAGGVTLGGMFSFFHTYHFRNTDFQTPTSWIVGGLVGALALRVTWRGFPPFMDTRANLVAPILDDCRRSLTN